MATSDEESRITGRILIMRSASQIAGQPIRDFSALPQLEHRSLPSLSSMRLFPEGLTRHRDGYVAAFPLARATVYISD
jgi:hypothetical protein